MMRWIAITSLLLGIAACSDDETSVQDSAPEGAPDLALADGGVDGSPDLAPDLPPADHVGQLCTVGGTDCGSGYVCLAVGGTAGRCTMECTPDDPASLMLDEDSCPGDDLTCAPYSASAAPPTHYCFERLANTPPSQACNAGLHGPIDESDAMKPQDPQMAAARLTAPAPFVALAVRYEVVETNNTCCDATLAHRCDVWASDAAAPETSPTPAESFAVPQGSDHAMHSVVHWLSTPLTLKTDQRLYVALEQATDQLAGKALCAMVCGGLPGEDSFVSDTTQPPYVWSTLKDHAQDREFVFWALGFYNK